MVLTHNHSIGTNWIFAHWLIMVRSRNWPDLWWQISKIRDIQVVGIYDLMKRWRFETNLISSVATAQPQSQKPVFDFDLTWWPDLWWPGVEIFTQGVKFNCKQVFEKMAALRAAVFPLSAKNRRGGHVLPPPPSSARVKCLAWDRNVPTKELHTVQCESVKTCRSLPRSRSQSRSRH